MQIALMPLRNRNFWRPAGHRDESVASSVAYAAGRAAFLDGEAISQMPDTLPESERMAWIAGWQRGLKEEPQPRGSGGALSC